MSIWEKNLALPSAHYFPETKKLLKYLAASISYFL
jgi:hypothetical protein